jgi:tetratricopeptide (TPR) repeat protein
MTALPRLAGALLCVRLGTAGGAPSSGETPRAVRLWLDGDAEAAVTALAELPPSRERDFNEAVVLLYRGDAAAAERLLLLLRARHEGWTPALRWLARAEKALGRLAASDTAIALLRSSDAAVRDRLWAARLFGERNDLQRARDGFRRAVASEDDLYLAWTGLADVEAALGHPEAARAARARAEALYPGGPTPQLAALAPLPARPLRYRVKYLFVPLADVTLAEGAPLQVRGQAARVLTLEARSTAPFFHMDSRLESFLGRDGALLGRRNLSSDSTSPRRQAVVDVDPATGAFRVRQVRDGLFEYDVLLPPTPARAHDGLSLVEAARSVARSGASLSVLRIADSGWKGTLVRRARAERIRWQGKDVDTVCVEIGIASRGAAGLHGALQLWISDDARAIPYRAKMAIAIGSVTLELVPPEPVGTSGPG